MYEFFTLPQDFRDSPRIFTNIIKPVLAHVRKQGHTPVICIDDTLLQGDSFLNCETAVWHTAQALDNLGFTIHPCKSVLKPTKTIQFLGFQLESVSVTVSSKERKARKPKTLYTSFLSKADVTIRQLLELLGK